MKIKPFIRMALQINIIMLMLCFLKSNSAIKIASILQMEIITPTDPGIAASLQHHNLQTKQFLHNYVPV